MKRKRKRKKNLGVGEMMAAPSGPLYGPGNHRLSENDELQEIKKLAGVNNKSPTLNNGSNISITAAEKAKLMKEHNIKPGTPEWFRLWFSLPYMTNEKPIG